MYGHIYARTDSLSGVRDLNIWAQNSDRACALQTERACELKSFFAFMYLNGVF